MKKDNYLLICSQNVGRSQMGEGYLRSLAESNPTVGIMSAGVETRGMRRKYHNRPHPQVVAVMQEDGVDISQNRITQLRKRHMRKADYVIAFCAQDELPSYASRFASKILQATVADPAPIISDVPLLQIDRLRKVRDQIKHIITDVYEPEFFEANTAEKLKTFEELFGTKHPVIGAVHFSPLPGYEGFDGLEHVYERASKDVRALEKGGANSIIFENNYDIPHKTDNVGQETEQAMTELITRLKQETTLPIGISVLFNDYHAALRIAKEVGADFIRVPVFVDHIMTNYGEIFGNPDDVTTYRKEIGAENILIFPDIHVKHATILNPETIEQSALRAIEKGADGLIITGKWTGDAPNTRDLQRVRNVVGDFPIILGSGVNEGNISSLFQVADGAIVGTSLKEGLAKDGEVNVKAYDQRMSEEKVRRLMERRGNEK